MTTTKPTTSTPLLNSSTEPTGAPASKLSVTLVNILGYGRAATGIGLLLAPTFIGKLFLIPVAPHSAASAVLRMVGVRDIVLGELTWLGRPRLNEGTKVPNRTEPERRELRKLLWGNIATDGLDVACLAYAAYHGALPRNGAALVGGVALAFVGMGLTALKDA